MCDRKMIWLTRRYHVSPVWRTHQHCTVDMPRSCGRHIGRALGQWSDSTKLTHKYHVTVPRTCRDHALDTSTPRSRHCGIEWLASRIRIIDTLTSPQCHVVAIQFIPGVKKLRILEFSVGWRRLHLRPTLHVCTSSTPSKGNKDPTIKGTNRLVHWLRCQRGIFESMWCIL